MIILHRQKFGQNLSHQIYFHFFNRLIQMAHGICKCPSTDSHLWCMREKTQIMNYFATTKCCLHHHCNFIEIIYQRHRIHPLTEYSTPTLRNNKKLRAMCSDGETHTKRHTPQSIGETAKKAYSNPNTRDKQAINE